MLSRPRLAATIAAGAYGIAYLAALTYYAYVTAHSLHATAKPPPPAYVPIYRIFRTVVERTAPLCQQRRWLRQRRYIYSLQAGRSFKHGILAPRLPPSVRRRLLASPDLNTHSAVQAPLHALRTHYVTLFTRPPPPVTFPGGPAAFHDALPTHYHALSPAALTTLSAPLTAAEVLTAATALRDTAVGPFGINTYVIVSLLRQPALAPSLLAALTNTLASADPTPLWDTLLTAIPKPHKDSSLPQHTRPISVTSLWYRLLMKVFTIRLRPHLPTLYADAQHGFCPGRSRLSAIATLLPAID